MKKRKVGFRESIIQFCLCFTIIILVWAFLKPFFDVYEEIGFKFFQVILVIITGIGAIGIYVILGKKVYEAFEWIGNKK